MIPELFRSYALREGTKIMWEFIAFREKPQLIPLQPIPPFIILKGFMRRGGSVVGAQRRSDVAAARRA